MIFKYLGRGGLFGPLKMKFALLVVISAALSSLRSVESLVTKSQLKQFQLMRKSLLNTRYIIRVFN
jgi:hypothetical protein